jgi:DNA (cytosine-5)-methyltransferase 1
MTITLPVANEAVDNRITDDLPSTTNPTKLRFVDLFAGLGAFHIALDRLGAECVFASEIEPGLCTLYNKNFEIVPHGDIRKVTQSEVPEHDILCAGFPCQSFSKAGLQLGLECEENGDLIHKVIDIVRWRHPKYLMLENVPNLFKHNKGETWREIKNALEDEGYEISYNFLSPHEFGIPQVRQRMFIVGSRIGLENFTWPSKTGAKPSIKKLLAEAPAEPHKPLPKALEECLEVWQQFLDKFPKTEELPSFPIWTMEFGANYPIEGIPPIKMSKTELSQYRGAAGLQLKGATKMDLLLGLPSHAVNTDKPFPKWKTTFIKQNREFYEKHKSWLDEWLPLIRRYSASQQKFEWNCKGEVRDLWQHVLQIRASGVRVKRATTAPSLIAMTSTQVPIIGWERRYMTPRECARLQSIPAEHILPATSNAAYKALGNAVNVDLVNVIAEALLYGKTNTRHLFNIEPSEAEVIKL